MSRTVTLTLDEETAAYLDLIASGQGRSPAEIAAWIVTEDLRRERAIDAELIDRLGAEGSISRSLYGICADLGPAPTDAAIDQARQEMWGTFPREDVA